MNIQNLSVLYGENKVLNDLSMQLENGEITCILGCSGAGKTTFLRWLAGLKKATIPSPGDRISYVFQEPRLIENISVLKNLTIIGASELEATNILATVGLKDKINALASMLSGGEKQRVNLARAFLNPTDLCLMDEPFSSLDLKTKLELINVFFNLYKKSNQTVVFVTHDIEEALMMANKVVVLKDGKINFELKLNGSLPRKYGELENERAILLEKITE